MIAAMSCFPPRACSLQDFYPKLFPKQEKKNTLDVGLTMRQGQKRIFGNSIKSAEQFEMLVGAGYAQRGKKCHKQ